MPIRLNLLAEAQALEEQRRRDPVKRAIWIGVFLIVAMLGWASTLYVQTLLARGQLGRVRALVAADTNEYTGVLQSQAQARENRAKLAKLGELTRERFLNANLLEALQYVNVADVPLQRLKVDMTYQAVAEVKGKTNSAGQIVGAKRASVRENIVVTLDARDQGPVPGDKVNEYRDTLTTNGYFASALSRTNGVRLTYVGAPTTLPESKPFVPFTVEGRYPEHLREAK